MRTKALVLGAAILAAGALSSMAQSNVYSLNVVGYVNVPLRGAGNYNLICNPLDSGNNTYSNLFGNLATGSSVIKWDPVGVQFVGVGRSGFGTHWSPSTAGSNILNPGEGVFILLAGSDVTNTFTGTVLQGTMTNTFTAGYTLQANPVPVGGVITTLGITNVPTGSSFIKWDVTNQQYVATGKTGFGFGWSPAVVPSIGVGEGFFLLASSQFSWVQTFAVQ